MRGARLDGIAAAGSVGVRRVRTDGISALSTLNATEKAAVLDELTSRDIRPRDRAGRIAVRHLGGSDASEIGGAVVASILALESSQLASRSGRTCWGYVEPTQAALGPPG